jgi:hypothetical protein
MKKDLRLVQAVYPMPVLMVAAYDENQKVDVMNVAWGQICDVDQVFADENEEALFAWNGYGKIATAKQGE